MSSADAATPTPRRTLANLPTELKAQIVGMARAQDRAYKQRSWCLRDAEKTGTSEWVGRSLNALFSVNREWSALAAAELFEHVTSKCCNSAVFKSSIVRRYADKIKHVSFGAAGEAGDQADSEVLLSAMRHLSNLTTLTIDTPSTLNLFGLGYEEVEHLELEHFMRRQELRDVGRSVTNFVVDELFASDLRPSLECLPALSSLKLSIQEMDEEDDDDDDLTLETRRQIFAGLSTLRSLTLDSIAIKSFFIVGETLVDWELRWSLCRLEVHPYSLEQLSTTFTLAQHSADTLTSFEIRIGSSDVPSNDQGVGQLSLPHLSRLHIVATCPQIEALLPLFKCSPISSLDLVVDPPDASALLDFALELFKPQLKKLHIDINQPFYDASKSITAALLDTLVSRAAQEGVTLVMVQPRYDVFDDFSKYQEERRVGTVRRCDGVDEVLRFGMAQSARIRAVGDVVAAGELVEALRPMRARMMREKD